MPMRFWPALLILLVLLFACSDQQIQPSKYPRMIGDIAHDPSLDSPDFTLCKSESRAVQYYAYTNSTGEYPYVEEKDSVIKTFSDNYDPTIANKESGLVRIRFLVNCEGQAGRYRLIGMDEEYNEKTFDTSITDQLLSITKNKVKWKPFEVGAKKRDYYMYMIFKIADGEIIEIMP